MWPLLGRGRLTEMTAPVDIWGLDDGEALELFSKVLGALDTSDLSVFDAWERPFRKTVADPQLFGRIPSWARGWSAGDLSGSHHLVRRAVNSEFRRSLFFFALLEVSWRRVFSSQIHGLRHSIDA